MPKESKRDLWEQKASHPFKKQKASSSWRNLSRPLQWWTRRKVIFAILSLFLAGLFTALVRPFRPSNLLSRVDFTERCQELGWIFLVNKRERRRRPLASSFLFSFSFSFFLTIRRELISPSSSAWRKVNRLCQTAWTSSDRLISSLESTWPNLLERVHGIVYCVSNDKVFILLCTFYAMPCYQTASTKNFTIVKCRIQWNW